MSGRYLKGIYKSKKTKLSEWYESSYELERFKALDASPLVKFWTKSHGLRIPYRIKKRKHHYIPDILVEYRDGKKYLEEVKGFVFNRIQFGAKNIAAISYCMSKGMTFRIIFKEQLAVVL